MRSPIRFLDAFWITCIGACLLSFSLTGCDSAVTDSEQHSAATTTDAGPTLSAKPNCDEDPNHPSCKDDGGGDSGGSDKNYEQTLSDALVGSGPVVLAKDNKKTLETTSSTFVLDFNFDATAATPITHLQTDPAGRTRDEILADGECAFDCADPDCSAAPGGLNGVRDRLHGLLTRAGDTRPLDLTITVAMEHLGESHFNHFIRIRDFSGPGGPDFGGPGYPYMDFGKCGAPHCQPVADFSGPGVDPRDATVARNFRFHHGTVDVNERFTTTTNAGGASLICNNLDEVAVKVEPTGS